MQEFGFEPHPVEFRIAFGTGGSAWTNHRSAKLKSHLTMIKPNQSHAFMAFLSLMCSFGSWLLPCSDSELVQRLQPEIERFGRVLRWVHRLEPVFVFIPINKVCVHAKTRTVALCVC
jgi:hypothetical protein